MARRARFTESPNTDTSSGTAAGGKGRPAFDPRTIHKVDAHPDRVTVAAMFVREYEPTSFSQSADVIVGEIDEAATARQPASIQLHDGTTCPAFSWVGGDDEDGEPRRIVVNVFKRGMGKGQTPLWYPFAKPPTIGGGDYLRGGRKISGVMPTRPHTLATQFNLEASVAVSKKSGDVSVYWQGTDITESTDGGINFLPVEERYVYAMPYETQLLPKVIGLSDEEYAAKYTAQAYTPENLPADANPVLAMPFYVPARAVRLSVNRDVREQLDSEQAWKAPFVLPDESVVHDFERTANGGAEVAVSVKRVSVHERNQTKLPSLDMTLTLLVHQYTTPSAPKMEQIIQNITIYGNHFLTATGISYVPLLATFLNSPTAAFGSVPFDLVYRPDVRAAIGAHLNTSNVEQRLAGYKDGDVPGRVENVIVRMCEFVYYRCIPVSLELARARMNRHAVSDADHAFVPGDISAWEKAAFSIGDTGRLPADYNPKNYTLDRNPGFVVLDMLTRPDLEDRTDLRWFAYPCFDLTDAYAPAFVPINPDDPLSTTRIAIESEAEGDAYVLGQLARIHGTAGGSNAVVTPQELEALRSGKATVASVGRNPLIWMQPKITQGSFGTHRLPYFAIIGIPAAYTPLDRASVVQPSRRMDVAAATAPAPTAVAAAKRTAEEAGLDASADAPDAKRQHVEIEQTGPIEFPDDDEQ